jgi:cyclic pyranopterin phosphate synthase
MSWKTLHGRPQQLETTREKVSREGWWCYNSTMMSKRLTHFDEEGHARMVDVGGKPDSDRVAVARGELHMRAETLALIREGGLAKGDPLGVAQVAGVLAAKRTSDLIPLCHPLPLNQVTVELDLDPSLPGVHITATVRTRGKTGVEMEALTAVSIAALTIYDMVKAVEKTMRVQNVRLVEKRGGQSGDVINE